MRALSKSATRAAPGDESRPKTCTAARRISEPRWRSLHAAAPGEAWAVRPVALPRLEPRPWRRQLRQLLADLIGSCRPAHRHGIAAEHLPEARRRALCRGRGD